MNEEKSTLSLFFDAIFHNAGKKLQLFAKILFAVDVIGMIIGIIMIYHTYHVDSYYSYYSGYSEAYMETAGAIGIAVCIASGIMGLVGTFVLYAFGQLVDDVRQMKAGNGAIDLDDLPDL